MPLPGSSLQAKFQGPYEIEEKLSDLDYVVRTPERYRKSCVCHINMLKSYVVRSDFENSKSSPTTCPSVAVPVEVVSSVDSPCADDLRLGSTAISSGRLPNSETLAILSSKLSHLSESSRNELLKLIERFSSLFSDVPTVTSVLKHNIDVADHRPIKKKAYRVNPVKRQIMKQETDYLVKHGLAVPSSSPWCSPCLLVPKPDGSSRFCTDYRKVNQVTKADSYPLPRIEDCVD